MLPIDILFIQFKDIWWAICLIFMGGFVCCVIEVMRNAKSKNDVY